MTKPQRWKAVRDAGHSGASIALRLGLSKQTVCRHLSGSQFNHDTADRIAEVLGTTTSAMWPRAPRKAAA